MPFFCGVQEATIPISILTGVVFGFILMWAVFGKQREYERGFVCFFLACVHLMMPIRVKTNWTHILKGGGGNDIIWILAGLSILRLCCKSSTRCASMCSLNSIEI